MIYALQDNMYVPWTILDTGKPPTSFHPEAWNDALEYSSGFKDISSLKAFENFLAVQGQAREPSQGYPAKSDELVVHDVPDLGDRSLRRLLLHHVWSKPHSHFQDPPQGPGKALASKTKDPICSIP